MSDEYVQAVAAIAAAILQRMQTGTGQITEEDVKQAVLIADRGLEAGIQEAQGSPRTR